MYLQHQTEHDNVKRIVIKINATTQHHLFVQQWTLTMCLRSQTEVERALLTVAQVNVTRQHLYAQQWTLTMCLLPQTDPEHVPKIV